MLDETTYNEHLDAVIYTLNMWLRSRYTKYGTRSVFDSKQYVFKRPNIYNGIT